MLSLLRWLFSEGRKPVPRRRNGRAVLRVEQLDERIVPAVETIWTNAAGGGLWSIPGNWSNGLPDANKIAVFTTTPPGSNAACIFDGAVLDANRIVAGLRSTGGYSSTLSLNAGKSLTVSSLADPTTGFQWGTGNISQASLNDVL